MSEKKGVLISIIGFMQGGAEIMPIRIANELHRQKIRIAVHCLEKETDEMIRRQLDPGIPVYYTDRAAGLLMILLRHGYEVVHTHSVPSQQLTARMRRRFPFLKIRHIATSHGGYEGLKDTDAAKAVFEADRFTDVWTYVAENNKETLLKYGVSEKRMCKIGNAMAAPAEIGEVFPQTFGIPKDAYVFTVITRAVWKKSWRECIEAVREARRYTGENIHLILGGTGPVYEELIQENTEDFVHLIGPVSDPCGLYRASYCGLLLSVRECAPLGLIEMYHAGIPVVATDTGDVAEMMTGTKGKTGILIELGESGTVNLEAASAAISRLVQNKNLYEECRSCAKEKSKEFRMDRVIEQYLECYKEKIL